MKRVGKAGLLVAGVLFGVGVVVPWPAVAATDTTRAPDPAKVGDLSPEAMQVAIDLTRTDHRLAVIEQQLARTQARLADSEATLSLTVGFISSNRDAVERLRERARADAVTAYQSHAAAQSAALSVDSVDDLSRSGKYISAASRSDNFEFKELIALQQQLGTLQDTRTAARDDIASAAQALQVQRARLASLQAKERSELESWGALPIMGGASLGAADLAAWYRSTGSTPRLAEGTTIDDVSRYFIEEGADEGVRGDIAFAQSIIETGYFTVAAGNNFSGIGACDSCTGGLVFATPRNGVRAQVQLLRNYADPDSRAANLAHVPEAGLYGSDPVAAARLYDTFFLKGKSPLWNTMGNGNWATDPVYAGKVVKLYAAMVAFAHRS